jgi:hypothetical protein
MFGNMKMRVLLAATGAAGAVGLGTFGGVTIAGNVATSDAHQNAIWNAQPTTLYVQESLDRFHACYAEANGLLPISSHKCFLTDGLEGDLRNNATTLETARTFELDYVQELQDGSQQLASAMNVASQNTPGGVANPYTPAYLKVGLPYQPQVHKLSSMSPKLLATLYADSSETSPLYTDLSTLQQNLNKAF